MGGSESGKKLFEEGKGIKKILKPKVHTHTASKDFFKNAS
jgi:hypothetical protein